MSGAGWSGKEGSEGNQYGELKMLMFISAVGLHSPAQCPAFPPTPRFSPIFFVLSGGVNPCVLYLWGLLACATYRHTLARSSICYCSHILDVLLLANRGSMLWLPRVVVRTPLKNARVLQHTPVKNGIVTRARRCWSSEETKVSVACCAI